MLSHWILGTLLIRIIKIVCFWEAIHKGNYKYQKHARTSTKNVFFSLNHLMSPYNDRSHHFRQPADHPAHTNAPVC